MKKIVIKSGENEILSLNANITSNFRDRFIGLMGRAKFEDDEALCIQPCNSIHMFFMKFPIDVLFVDKSGCIVYLIEDMKPWTVSKIVKKAQCVIEMPAGSIQKMGFKINDSIKMISKGI